jgi:hypothetical protein
MPTAYQGNLKLLLLSGPLSVGKSSVTSVLISKHGYTKVRSGSYIASVASIRGQPQTRSGLQEVGDSLDCETDYLWLLDQVAKPAILGAPSQRLWVVDAVRKNRQVAHFRNEFRQAIDHVHLYASEEVLRQRYELRQSSGDDYVGQTPYNVAVRHPNEVAARSLIEIADLAIDVGEGSPEEAASLIVQRALGGAR